MTERDHPAIVVPPPLLYVVAFALVVVLNWFWPVPILLHPVTGWCGAAILVLGVALNLWGAYAMRQARTPINPYKPVATMVASGAFRVSRNPLYVGLSLIFLGLTFVLNSLWGIIVFAPMLVVMHYGVILREERYLEKKFGEAYRQYSAKVRRYL